MMFKFSIDAFNLVLWWQQLQGTQLNNPVIFSNPTHYNNPATYKQGQLWSTTAGIEVLVSYIKIISELKLNLQ